MVSKQNERNSNFQHSFSYDEIVDRRDTSQIQLRKRKRSDFYARKRLEFETAQNQNDIEGSGSRLLCAFPELETASFYQKIEHLVGLVCHNGWQLDALYTLKQIAVSINPDDNIPPGLHPSLTIKLIDLLQSTSPLLKSLSLDILSNMMYMSSRVIEIACDYKILEILGNFLSQDEPDLFENILWCLGNITGDNSTIVQEVLQLGLYEMVIDRVWHRTEWVGTATWFASNLCIHKTVPLSTKQNISDFLVQVLQLEDPDAKVYACIGIKDYIQAGGFIEGILDKILAIIRSVPKPEILKAALQTLDLLIDDRNRIFDIINVLAAVIKDCKKKEILRIAIPVIESIILHFPCEIPQFITTDWFSNICDFLESYTSDKVEMGLTIVRTVAEKTQIVSSFLDGNLCWGLMQALEDTDLLNVKQALEIWEILLCNSSMDINNERTVAHSFIQTGLNNSIEKHWGNYNTEIHDLANDILNKYFT